MYSSCCCQGPSNFPEEANELNGSALQLTLSVLAGAYCIFIDVEDQSELPLVSADWSIIPCIMKKLGGGMLTTSGNSPKVIGPEEPGRLPPGNYSFRPATISGKEPLYLGLSPQGCTVARHQQRSGSSVCFLGSLLSFDLLPPAAFALTPPAPHPVACLRPESSR